MECLVMLNGVPESGRSAELASDTGTPRCVASRVSAQPLTAIASVRTDARVTSTRFTALLEIGGGRRGWGAPQGAGSISFFNKGVKPLRSPRPPGGARGRHPLPGPASRVLVLLD